MSKSPQTPQVSLSPDSSATFLIRWRGRQEGPYPATVIEAKLAANQIGLLHEIFHNDQWVTLRDYFAEREAALRAERQAREEQEGRAGEEAERQAKEREKQRRVATPTEEGFKTAALPQDEKSSLANPPDWQAAILSPREPLCRICGLGRLVKLKQYRMSLPVVVIGYFLLVPSAIGMLLSTLGLAFYLIGGGVQVSQSATPDKGVAVLATMFGSAFFLILLVMSFIGGVFGWLLIMKKKVLQCTNCGAVVAAS